MFQIFGNLDLLNCTLKPVELLLTQYCNIAILSALIVINKNLIWETGAASHSKRISTMFSAHEISSSKTTLKPRAQTDDHQSIRAKRTTNEKNAPIRWFVCLSFFIVHQPLFERSQRVATISWKRWKALGSCQRPEARRGWATHLAWYGQSESIDLGNLALQTSSYIYIQSPVALR